MSISIILSGEYYCGLEDSCLRVESPQPQSPNHSYISRSQHVPLPFPEQKNLLQELSCIFSLLLRSNLCGHLNKVQVYLIAVTAQTSPVPWSLPHLPTNF